VPEVLAAALLPVVLYCAARALGLRRRAAGAAGAAGHPRDLDLWHVLMGTAMLAMLVGRFPAGATVPVLALSALAVGWGMRSMQQTASAAAYARLTVGGVAMAVMVPLAPAQAAAGAAGADSGMAPMGQGLWLPLAVALMALLASAAWTALSTMVRPGEVVRRLHACCDVVMAVAMTTMLVRML
jgi:hypothetical protein